MNSDTQLVKIYPGKIGCHLVRLSVEFIELRIRVQRINFLSYCKRKTLALFSSVMHGVLVHLRYHQSLVQEQVNVIKI